MLKYSFTYIHINCNCS